MREPNNGWSPKILVSVLLAVTIAMLTAVLLTGQIAEAQRGGGGRGGGGGGKPSGSISKPSNVSPSGKASGDKGLPSGVANPASPYYNSPRYGLRYGVFSNFFLWSWLFHDHDDEEYEEEYVEPNYDPSGWIVTAIGLVAIVGLSIWLKRRFRG